MKVHYWGVTMTNQPNIQPHPEFIYDERQDYKTNYWRWRDMSNYEAKSENRLPYSEERAKMLFQQQYGYHSNGVKL